MRHAWTNERLQDEGNDEAPEVAARSCHLGAAHGDGNALHLELKGPGSTSSSAFSSCTEHLFAYRHARYADAGVGSKLHAATARGLIAADREDSLDSDIVKTAGGCQGLGARRLPCLRKDEGLYPTK